jgi:outer membrane protein
MLRKIAFFPLVFFCLANASLAQSGAPTTPSPAAQPLSLEDAVRIALERHPALRRAEAAVAFAEAEVKQVRASYFPQLSFSGIGKVGLSGAAGALGLPGFPASPFYRNTAYSANWYQTIFDFGRIKHHVALQRALSENAQLEKKAEEDRIVLAVRRTYFSTLEAQRLQRVAEETVKERRLTLQRVQAYYQAQLRSQLDVSLAQANFAEAQGSLIQARNTVGTAFAALWTSMGVDGGQPYELQTPQTEVLSFPPLEELVQAGLTNRPDLQALERRIAAISEQVGLAHSERLPEIRGFAAGGQGRFTGTTVKPIQRHGLGALGLFFPFFTGGRLEATEEAARAELQGAEAARDELRQQIRLEVTQAYYQLLDLVERIQVAAEQERAAQQALRLAQARFQMQLASFVELTSAEVGLTRAETSHARTLFDYQRAKADLDFATGQAPRP